MKRLVFLLSQRKALLVFVIAILLVSLPGTDLLLKANNRTASAADSTFYDFVAQASNASWGSGAGSLPFPGADSDNRGFACYRDNWQLEDKSTGARVLETHPQWIGGGWIAGTYPQLTIPSDAELKVTVGFLDGATGTTGVTFEVQFKEFLGLKVAPKTYSILTQAALYDGKLDSISESLSNLAGKTGNFVLRVDSGQDSGRDWAAWAEAKIKVAAPAALPDLAVGSIERDPGGKLQVTIENIGSGGLPSGWSAVAEVYFNGTKKGAFNLKAPTSTASGGIEETGGNSTYLLAWNITKPVTVRVVVDSTDEIEESNEQNNIGEEEVGPPVIQPPPITPPVTPPPVELPCYISGEILGFDYCLDTLKIKVCPADSIDQCTPDAGVSYVDVVRLPAEPAPTLTYLPLGPVKYQARVSCNGSYIIEPVYSPQATGCSWIGSWEPSRYFVNMRGSKPLSTVPRDFHFVPYDSQPPTMRILVNKTRPKPNEDVLVTILGYDDKGISAIWRQTDITFLNGSRQTGPWVKYTDIVAGLENSTGGVQFAITDNGIMQAIVVAKVCDIGGNECSSRLTLSYGTCDDCYQDYGETGVDCGGPCPSRCLNCLGDYELGNNPSVYLYSPEHWDFIREWAATALSEYAGNHSLSLLELDTSDEMMDAIAWWVMKHMSYRADEFNEQINDNLHLGYDPGDYAHDDFPQPAYYTLSYSGLWRNTINYTDDEGGLHTWNPPADSEKWFFGDCEDFGILQVALLRSLGVSHRCVFNVEEPTHSTTIIYYKGKHRIRDYGAITYGNIWVDNLWNDKIGAFGNYYGIENGSFPSVRPWEYTMNYPGCESPRVEITGGGFGAESVWLDWDGWGTNKLAAAGDFNGDGKDDILAIWYNFSKGEFDGKVLNSSGVNFEAPSESLGAGAHLSSSYPVYPLVGEKPSGHGGDFAEVFYVPLGDEESGPRLWSVLASWKHIDYVNAEVVRMGDPNGDGVTETVEFFQGEGGNVTVRGSLWRQSFSVDGEVPFVGDFDGDGADDIITFSRGDLGDVWVARSWLNSFCWASYKWHDNFCLGNETPLIGDFNGDGRDDIITFKKDTGQVFVALSTIFGFGGDGWLWKDNFCYGGDTPLVGDFNGDGRDDIASLSEHNGTVSISVALANSSNMSYVPADPNCSLCQVSFFQDAYFPSKCP